MITILSALVSLLSFRVCSRASLELELIALRHQVTVLRRQRPGQLRLFSTDRLLWVWLYRVWAQVLNAMVLVKPATVVQWHRTGFRLYWRWRSRRALGHIAFHYTDSVGTNHIGPEPCAGIREDVGEAS